MSSNSNSSFQSLTSAQRDGALDFHCRPWVCKTCKCRGYPQCYVQGAEDFEEPCEDCMDWGDGSHKPMRDMYDRVANPAYDPVACGDPAPPLMHYNHHRRAVNSNNAAMNRLRRSGALSSDEMEQVVADVARLRTLGSSAIGERRFPGVRLQPRGQQMLDAMRDQIYAPGGVGMVAAQDRVEENLPLAQRLQQMRATRLHREEQDLDVPLAERLRRLRAQRLA